MEGLRQTGGGGEEGAGGGDAAVAHRPPEPGPSLSPPLPPSLSHPSALSLSLSPPFSLPPSGIPLGSLLPIVPRLLLPLPLPRFRSRPCSLCPSLLFHPTTPLPSSLAASLPFANAALRLLSRPSLLKHLQHAGQMCNASTTAISASTRRVWTHAIGSRVSGARIRCMTRGNVRCRLWRRSGAGWRRSSRPRRMAQVKAESCEIRSADTCTVK
eukprot:3260720-Rhodomonas_salina.3